ncbi:hypothetical protein ACQQ2N_17620 [Dokdonella sp. MW10]|uniref:hypothetical protein n=1 Tax=Dokdonella sp. MW10 TaxID=2992926 RepID=UPI003F816241
MTTPRDHESELDRLIDGDGGDIGGVYRRLSRAEPPRRLDRMVLAEAARAVRAQRPRGPRWLVGFGSVAGVVLAAGIAWQVGERMQNEAPGGAQAPAPASAPATAPREVIQIQTIAIPDTTSDAASRQAAPAAEVMARKAEPEAKKEAPRQKQQASKPAPAPPPPPPPAPAASAPPEPVLMQRRMEAVPVEAAPEAASRASAEAADAAPSSHAGEAKAGAAAEAELGGNATGSRIKDDGVRALPARAPSASVQLRRNMQLAPETWLAEIVRLERAGRHQQARENLSLFRRLHPDWELPESLKHLQE